MVILTTFPPPTDGVKHKQDNCQVFIGDKNLGNGTIFIAESRLSWMSGTDQGFSLEYKSISLHAVSRDTTSFGHECLYLQVEGYLNALSLTNPAVVIPDEEHLSSSSEEEGDPPPPMTEVRFVPSDKGVLDAMFTAMTECQALHPDESEEVISDDEEEDDEYYEESGGGDNLTERGQAALNRLDEMLVVPEDQAEEPQIGAQAANGVPPSAADSEPMDTGQFEDVEPDH